MNGVLETSVEIERWISGGKLTVTDVSPDRTNISWKISYKNKATRTFHLRKEQAVPSGCRHTVYEARVTKGASAPAEPSPREQRPLFPAVSRAWASAGVQGSHQQKDPLTQDCSEVMAQPYQDLFTWFMGNNQRTSLLIYSDIVLYDVRL